MNRSFQIIAHRGASSECPENTPSAIARALALGVDWIEIDIRLTKDGEWMVIHDESLERFGGGKAKVEETDSASLKRVDVGSWFGSEFKDERILTLREAVRTVLVSSSLILDIKTKRDARALSASLLETLVGADLSRVVFSSFSPALLNELNRLRPGLRLGYLFKNFPLLRTRSMSKGFLYSVHPKREVFSARVAAEARARGIRTFVWTVNQPLFLEQVLQWGGDGVFTDHPAEARRWLEDLARGPAPTNPV
jgi:glycerophosphoryl diester phosphodiesterase